MFAVDVISRVVHVATAIMLVGGSAFTLLVLLPSTKSLDEPSQQKFSIDLMARWKRFVHLGIGLFLLSGFYNFYRALESHQGDSLYHALVGIKILLAFFVFFIASALVGSSRALERLRQNRQTWLSVMVLTSLVIVAISGFLKVR